jgi:hypothetical protein
MHRGSRVLAGHHTAVGRLSAQALDSAEQQIDDFLPEALNAIDAANSTVGDIVVYQEKYEPTVRIYDKL